MEHSIFEKLSSEKTLMAAYEKTARKNVTPGVDGVDRTKYATALNRNIEELSFRLRYGIYTPLPTQMLLKGDMAIGIPCFEDKIVQNAIVALMYQKMQSMLIPETYAYIPNRSVFDAVEKFQKQMKRYNSCYKCDISKFFASIDHKLLTNQIEKILPERKLLELIELFLHPDCIGRPKHAGRKGLLMGNSLSPVLSNLYMLDFDKKQRDRNDYYLRYSDDIIIFNRNKEEEKAGMLKADLEALKLSVNEEKSAQIDTSGCFTYLGFKFGVGDDALYQAFSENNFKKALNIISGSPKLTAFDIGGLGVMEDMKPNMAILLTVLCMMNSLTRGIEAKELLNRLSLSAHYDEIKRIAARDREIKDVIFSLSEYFAEKGMYILAESLMPEIADADSDDLEINVIDEELLITQEQIDIYLCLWKGCEDYIGIVEKGDIRERHYNIVKS